VTGERAADATMVAGELRRILAEITGDEAALAAPPDTPLLRDGIGLDSVGGTVLLAEVYRRFGVDVAGEDLNLDSMATIGTLIAFIAWQCSQGAD